MYAVKLEELQSGGEALGLAKLFQKGFPVPRGFVVTREAYQKFMESATHPPSEQIPELKIPDSILSDLKERYNELSFDPDMKEVDEKALDLISAGRDQAFVSVRGSGLAVLNVHGFSSLQQAMKELWAAGSEEITVQKMLDSEKTGILSPHPSRDSLVIECAWGLAIPDRMNPDLFLVTSEGIEARTGKKERSIKKDYHSRKAVEEELPAEMQEKQTLHQHEISSLLELSKGVQELFQSPARIEFSFQRGKPWILQARPMERQEFSSPEIPEADFLARGDLIFPGSARGAAREVASQEDIEKTEPGDIIISETFQPEFLKTNASGMVIKRGCLQKLAGTIKIPSLRVEALPKIQGELFLDAVNGKIYSVKEAVPEPEPLQEPPQEKPEKRPKIMLSASSPEQEIPDCGGVALRAENILADGRSNSLEGSLRHPSLIAAESPNETIQALEAPLESLARKLFPRPLWYFSFDSRSDEMQGLEGAEKEQNPMLGWRGVRRSLEERVFPCELQALKRLYEKGMNNIYLILPFVSSSEELKKAKELISFPLKIGAAVETPAAAMGIESLCKEGIFAVQIDIDSLTQLTLGMDIDNPRFSQHFSRLSPAVEKLVKWVLETCKKFRVEVSVKGEACNNSEDLKKLLEWGANSVTADSDSMESIKRFLIT